MSRRRGPSEKQFMAQVVQLARIRGWLVYHTHDSRRCTDGFPDLVFLRGARQVVAELKRDASTRPTSEQEAWLAAFRLAGVSAYLWTPACWSEIEEVLE